MKQFNYVVTLVLLTVVAFSLGFAGKGTGSGVLSGNGPLLQQSTGQLTQINDPELQQRSNAGKAGHRFSPEAMSKSSRPTPRVDASSSVTAGLSGTYHIPGDFSSISNAVAVLNFNGVMGAVTFQLDAASYTELSPITFGTFPGAGTATVTIQPAAGLAVSVNFQPSASQGKGFAFNGAKAITIDGLNTGGASLTLRYAGGTFPSGDAFAATIYVTNGSDQIAVRNANIMGEIQTAGTFFAQTDGRPAVFVYKDAGPANTNITIDHCTVTNATYGLKVLSNPLAVQGPVSFTYNNVGGAFGAKVSQAALADGVFGMHYDYNVIDGIEFVPQYWNVGPTEYDLVNTFLPPNSFFFNFGQPSGGHFYNGNSASTISYNYVKDVHQNYDDPTFAFIIYGLLVRVGSGPSIHDNRITGIATIDANGTMVGIRSEAQAAHNSVRLTGTMLATQVSYCMRSAGGTNRNNAYSNEMTGGTAANTRALQTTPAGTSDGNGMFSNGQISTQTTLNAYLLTGRDPNSVFAPVSFDADMHITTGPSSAENVGVAGVLAAADIDGTVRDISAGGVRDAGADEFGSTGTLVATDILPTNISSPAAGGAVSGVTQTPAVVVKNNSNNTIGSFDVRLVITAPDAYDMTVTVATGIPPHASVTASFPTWTPTVAGARILTATTTLVGDVVAGNNVISRSQPVADPVILVAGTPKLYNWNAGADGWTGTGDWALSATSTKLGGVYGGAGSTWVTNPGAPGSGYHTQNPGVDGALGIVGFPGNFLYSPFFKATALADVYISFFHSINTEPHWDRSTLQYTTDAGTTWRTVGVVDDPNGINWYKSSIYENAHSGVDGNSEFDVGTWNTLGGFVAPPIDGWTTNNNGTPVGYVYQQIKFNALAGAPIVRFRYFAFSDNNTYGDGWAIDNFRIGDVAPVNTPAPVSGNVYDDADGSGLKDGAEAGHAGLVVELKYFGVHIDFQTSDVNGDYSLLMQNPGSYTVSISTPLGLSQPVGRVHSVDYTGSGVAVTGRNFGLYNGAISGKKFNDINDNGVDDGEPGLTGWAIEVRTGSCSGPIVASGATGAGGIYAIAVGPGVYYVDEVLQTSWRANTPVCGGPVTVAGASGGGTALVAGPNFGNFRLAVARLYLGIDVNGNGVWDGVGDNQPLPGGATENFEFRKNGVLVATKTLGNGTGGDFVQYGDLDVGTYSFTILGTPPLAWTRTLDYGGSASFVVATSGQVPQIHFLDYQAPEVSGVKFEDLNGNGVKDAGEPLLAGWKIDLSGGGSATTDGAGFYKFTGVSGGNHTLSEVVQPGWQATLPAGGSYTITASSKGLVGGPGDIVRDFGNFKKISISGMKYRDRNGNGVKDAGDNGLQGWSINATNGGGAQVTDANGDYSFAGLGPGTYVLTETAQAGYIQTAPAGGSHTVVASSGSDVSGRDFGNFQNSDLVEYRTWTLAELSAATEAKPTKPPKASKPYAAPNSGNLIAELLGAPKLAVLMVGRSGQMVSGKEKGWVSPAKQSDAFKTMNSKNVVHVGNPRPMSFDNTGLKRLLKRYKSLPASKANNVLMANLLVFKINLAASAKGQTDVAQNLGSVVYCAAGHPGLSGKSLDDIGAYADDQMTNWDNLGLPGFTSAMWADLNGVIEQVNGAFSTGLTSDITDPTSWHNAPLPKPKLRWVVKATAQSTSFLCAPGPGNAPSSHPVPTNTQLPVIPTEYGLGQNYPNPFNPTTVVSFDLPEASLVTIKVYNMLGQEVATLLNREELEQGTEEVEFDAGTLTSGVYFYHITAQAVDEDGITTGNAFTKTMKMVLVK